MLKSLILSISFIALLVLSSCSEQTDCLSCKTNNILYVGVLLDVTGPRADVGFQMQKVLEIAKQDIEADLAEKGFENKKIQFVIEDTKSDPQIALDKIKILKSMGIMPVIIQTSAEALAVRDYAKENDMILLAFESNAQSLAQKDDNLFRFCMNGKKFAKALTRLVKESNKKIIIPLVRDDVWGNDYLTEIKAESMKFGIEVAESVKYNVDENDFGTQISSLAQKIAQMKNNYQENEICVVMLCFSEVDQILPKAALNQDLERITWFGADGISQNSGFFEDPNALAFAQKVGLTITTFGVGQKDLLDIFYTKLQAKIGTQEILTQSAYLYDLVNTLSIVWQTTPSVDYNLYIKALPKAATYFQGCTDEIGLDENGDRMWGVIDYLKVSGGKFQKYGSITFGDWVQDGDFELE